MIPAGGFTVTTTFQDFLAPRDILPTAFTCWERGGTALEDISEGVDVRSWFFSCDPDTGVVTVGVPDVIAATSVYTISPLPLEFTASFDTAMRPVLAWRDVNNDSWLRWYDGGYTNLALPARAHDMRLALDDVRLAFFEADQTETVLAYILDGQLWMRRSSEDYAVATLVASGFNSLTQIGMVAAGNLFQMIREGSVPDTDAFLTFPRPDNRAGYVVGFDDAGDILAYEPAEGVQGDAGPTASFTVTDSGQTFFVRGDSGTWSHTTVDVTVLFYLDATTLQASRTFTFDIDSDGGITRTNSAGAGEVGVHLAEVGTGTRTYTLTAYPADGGPGVTFSLVAGSGIPTVSVFTPTWHSADFFPGEAPTGRFRALDYGTHVLFAAIDDTGYTGTSSSTRMRWAAGTIPEEMWIEGQRSIPCTVDRNGVTVPGLMFIEADGSAEFFPQVVADTHIVPGTFLANSATKGLAATFQVLTPPYIPGVPFEPNLISLSPDSALRFGATFTLTVNGHAFTEDSVVFFNDEELVTTFIDADTLEAEVLDTMIDGDAGDVEVYVNTPPPGGGDSLPVAFSIENDVPAITSIDPTGVSEDTGAVTVTITGTGFVPDSVAKLDGAVRLTAYNSETELEIDLLAGDTDDLGTFDITVTNFAPGGGTSAAEEFTVGNPVPTIVSLDPASVSEDGGALTLEVTGTNFIASSVVRWAGADRTTTFINSTTLEAAILSGDVDDAGTFEVKVFNPTPGGGLSNGSNFVVTANIDTPLEWDPATHGADITLSGSNLIATRNTNNNNNWRSVRGTIGKASGKWYWELVCDVAPTNNGTIVGAATSGQSQTSYPGDSGGQGRGVQSRPAASALQYINGSSSVTNNSPTNYTAGNVLGFALDMDGLTLRIYINNALHNTFTSLPAGTYYPCIGLYDNPMQFTIAPTFTYTPPTGHSPLV